MNTQNFYDIAERYAQSCKDINAETRIAFLRDIYTCDDAFKIVALGTREYRVALQCRNRGFVFIAHYDQNHVVVVLENDAIMFCEMCVKFSQ